MRDRQTAIGDAIGLAIKRLRNEPPKNRVLILLTDGASNAGTIDPLKAADLAAQEGVRIYTIGVGADDMVVEGPFGLPQRVHSDLDEESLEDHCAKERAAAISARPMSLRLQQIYHALDQIEPMTKDQQSWRPVDELYAWPLAGALLLSALIALSSTGLLGFAQPAVRHA